MIMRSTSRRLDAVDHDVFSLIQSKCEMQPVQTLKCQQLKAHTFPNKVATHCLHTQTCILNEVAAEFSNRGPEVINWESEVSCES
jgi:hypothetical protein